MTFCRINAQSYLVDLAKGEFYSVNSARTFVFSLSAKISDIRKYLAKYDTNCVVHN